YERSSEFQADPWSPAGWIIVAPVNMPKSSWFRALFLSSSVVACAGPPPSPPVAAPPPPVPSAKPEAPPSPIVGVDLAAMDRKVAPGDDFFLFANGTWYASAVIPPDRNATGVDLRVAEEVEKRTRSILEEADKAGASRPGTQKIGDYYASYLDEAGIEKR